LEVLDKVEEVYKKYGYVEYLANPKFLKNPYEIISVAYSLNSDEIDEQIKFKIDGKPEPQQWSLGK
jgi:hypothetical protein